MEAAQLVASRQASKKTPRTYSDYRVMLAEKDLDLGGVLLEKGCDIHFEPAGNILLGRVQGILAIDHPLSIAEPPCRRHTEMGLTEFRNRSKLGT